jgi:serine/threonine protein kinase
MIIGNKYELVKKINQGTFGALYQGKNIRTGELVAIKVEKRSENNINTLKYEANVYNYLKNIDRFVKLRWFGTNEKYNFLVIDLLGNSLKSELVINETKNNLEIVFNFGKKIINKLMILHENKIIHRDLKPDNILLNTDNLFEDIFLVDYSFCKKYINSNGEHILKNKINKLIGSVNYISLNVHDLIEPTRRDDLESVVYILIYLYCGKLDWENSMSITRIYEMKKNIIYDENIPEYFRNMIIYIRTLEFNERPNYFYLINFFS